MFLDFKAQSDCLWFLKTFSLDSISPVRALEPVFFKVYVWLYILV